MIVLERVQSARAIFIVLLILGTLVRLGYGAARHRESLTVTGDDFISRWDYDALEHVLIAKSLIDAREYRVADVPGLQSKHVRSVGHDAAFKAPLYQFFLAGVFAISGYNFLGFFPLQALIGGILSGLAALIALRTFHQPRAAMFAGAGAAMHPVLVNSASQPYNENLYLALLFGMIWAFVQWRRTAGLRWAVWCGVLGGLAILCRESAGFLLLALAVLALIAPPVAWRRAVVSASAMIVVAGLMVAPWLIRNVVAYGKPSISSGTAHVLGIGNNECLAPEPVRQVYWAEDACPITDAQRAVLIEALPADQKGNAAVTERIDGELGMAFITRDPGEYAKLSLRRAWSLYLPFHPRQQTGRIQRLAQLLFWLIVVPAGIAGVIQSLRAAEPNAMMLALLVAVTTVPLVLIYFSPDGRHRVPADLLLACFAGHLYSQLAARFGLVRP